MVYKETLAISESQKGFAKAAVAAAKSIDKFPNELHTILAQIAVNIPGICVPKSSPDHPQFDAFRKVVIDLFLAEGPNAKLKKAPIMEAAKMELKREISPNEYQKEESSLSQLALETMINALKARVSLAVLDKLLCNGDDATATATTPYTAAILEYRVVFHDKKAGSISENGSANGYANGSTVYDSQHPCQANVAVKKELHTPASDYSCTHLEFDISGHGLSGPCSCLL